MKSISLAARAKGRSAFLRRIHQINQRYSMTSARIDRALDQFARILNEFNCGASFPLTAVVLDRHPDSITRFLDRNIEFVVHGYAHIDYSQLPPAEQLVHLRRAREIFARAGVTAVGFRSPYLRSETHLYEAIEAAGFSYASNQPIMWQALDAADLNPSGHAAYQRAFEFYTPWDASKYPSLPRLVNQIVEIPVSLPDDEILIDRLDGEFKDVVERVWCHILSATHQRGELFTVQLHPERIDWCADGLSAVLSEARALTAPVWIARMDEIATWWRARAATIVNVAETGAGLWHLSITGPVDTTVLVRGIETVEPTKPWDDTYRRVILTPSGETQSVTCNSPTKQRPFIGVSLTCPASLSSFLRQQGYIVQISEDDQAYSVYLDQPGFAYQDELPLLSRVASSTGPLVRLGRWPDGARSGLCITGDIDALTLWDYGLRLFGR
jgi:peptidoglycan/xylan/chitin deacetylase (PgdA/CDA1 family)